MIIFIDRNAQSVLLLNNILNLGHTYHMAINRTEHKSSEAVQTNKQENKQGISITDYCNTLNLRENLFLETPPDDQKHKFAAKHCSSIKQLKEWFTMGGSDYLRLSKSNDLGKCQSCFQQTGKNKNSLDGCGLAEALVAINGMCQNFEFVGVDISPIPIRLCKEIYKNDKNARFYVVDASNLKDLRAAVGTHAMKAN